MEFGGEGDGFVEFDVPAGVDIFGDYVDPSIPLLNVESSVPMLAGGDVVFCKMCSSSSQEKYGDTCWAVLPAADTNRDCGCNSGSWAGAGVYYAGFETCDVCGCRAPNAFTGPAESGAPKGGVGSAGLRLYVKSEQEWALEDLGAVITGTSSDLMAEAPQCVGNIHNLLMPTPIHSCEGECAEDCAGDTRFMFGQGDADQTITLDLGAPRAVSRIGAEYSITDREVWDAIVFEVSADQNNWYEFGHVGTDGDAVPDIKEATAWVRCAELA
jgi:hypothetical protein